MNFLFYLAPAATEVQSRQDSTASYDLLHCEIKAIQGYCSDSKDSAALNAETDDTLLCHFLAVSRIPLLLKQKKRSKRNIDIETDHKSF